MRKADNSLILKLAKRQIVVLLISLIFPAAADAMIDYTLFPRLSIEGRYSDNYYAVEVNKERGIFKKDGLAITVSPGILISLFTKDSLLDLDYSLNSRGYFVEDEKDRFEFFNQRGSISFRSDLSRNFSILLRDEFIMDENTDIIDETYTREERRRRYIRNIGGGEWTYLYGVGRDVSAGYVYTILNYIGTEVDDSERRDFNARVRHSFDIRNIGEVTYRHSVVDYSLEDYTDGGRNDFYEDEVRGRFTHYFTQRLLSSLNYGYLETHYNTFYISDYRLHDASVESTYIFSRYLTADGMIGLFLRELYRKDETSEDSMDKGLSYRARVAYTYPTFSFLIASEGGYGSSYTSSEGLQFYDYWRARGETTYHLIRDILMLTGHGSYGFYRYPDYIYTYTIEGNEYSGRGRRDHILSAGGGINYRALDWLLFSLEYSYTKRNSNVGGLDYIENACLARITISSGHSAMEREREARERREMDRRIERGEIEQRGGARDAE